MVIFMSMGLILFAASPTITWNDKLVFQLPYSSMLYKYWGIFGSCGRMAWPVVYFFMIFGITSISKLIPNHRRLAYGILTVSCLIQVFDFSDQLIKRHENYANKVEYTSPLEGTVWDKIVSDGGYKHIVWVTHNVEHNDVMQVAILALEHDITMGNFYFARGIDNRSIVEQQLEHVSSDCIYVFLKEDTTFSYEMYENYEDVLYFYPCGEYMIGTVNPLEE